MMNLFGSKKGNTKFELGKYGNGFKLEKLVRLDWYPAGRNDNRLITLCDSYSILSDGIAEIVNRPLAPVISVIFLDRKDGERLEEFVDHVTEFREVIVVTSAFLRLRKSTQEVLIDYINAVADSRALRGAMAGETNLTAQAEAELMIRAKYGKARADHALRTLSDSWAPIIRKLGKPLERATKECERIAAAARA